MIKCNTENTKTLDMIANEYLNICLVSREYPPDTGWGGIGTYTYNLAHGLAEKGHNISVICQGLAGEKEYKDKNVSVYRIKHPTIFIEKGGLKEFALRLEYSNKVHKKICEIANRGPIHIIEGPNLAAELFIHSLSRKAPIITRLHTSYSEVIRFRGWKKTFDLRLSCWLEDATILRSDLVICSTNAHAKIIAEESGILQKNIEIIPLGIPLPESRSLSQAKNNSFPVVFFAGRLEKRKGIDILIKAVPLVLEDFPETRFLIAGRDTLNANGSYKSMLLKNLPEHCLNNVEFLGYVEPRMLDFYFSTCDLFAAPSLYESFGFVYLEAMSHAKPVIGCNTGGISEVVTDQKTGLLVPPDDHITLSAAVKKLLGDKKLREEIGKTARRHVENNFTQEIMADNTIRAYKELLTRLTKTKL